MTIDLGKLETTDGTTAEILERFLRAIQIMRQDFNGKVLTIRSSDLQLLARMIGDRSNIAEVLAPDRWSVAESVCS